MGLSMFILLRDSNLNAFYFDYFVYHRFCFAHGIEIGFVDVYIRTRNHFKFDRPNRFSGAISNLFAFVNTQEWIRVLMCIYPKRKIIIIQNAYNKQSTESSEQAKQTLLNSYAQRIYFYIHFRRYDGDMRQPNAGERTKIVRIHRQIESNWMRTLHGHTHMLISAQLRAKNWNGALIQSQAADTRNSHSRAQPWVVRWHTNENEQSSSLFFFIYIGIR